MLKYGTPMSIVFIFLMSGLGVIWYLTLRMDLSRVFKTTVQPPPPMAIKLQGVDGDSAIIGFGSREGSEKVPFVGKNLAEVKAGLSKIQIDQLEFITSITSTVFRFDVWIVSYPDSPDNAKKVSYFEVVDSEGVVNKIAPGKSLKIIRSSKMDDLADIISATDIKLVYENGLYQNFFDEDGNLVSQATGELVVAPAPLTQLFVFLGVWAFIVGLLFLVKQTLLSSKDLKEILEFIKTP